MKTKEFSAVSDTRYLYITVKLKVAFLVFINQLPQFVRVYT